MTAVKTISIDQGVVAEMAPNGMKALLRLLAGMDPKTVTEEICLQRLTKIGTSPAQIPSDALRRIIQQYQSNPTEEQKLELAGVWPIHGEHGRLEWHEGMDPTQRDLKPELGQVDHYNHSAFVTVATGQPFARIIPPTEGIVGLDLRGLPLQPNPGKPVQLNMNSSVVVDPDGTCRAATPGVLVFESQSLRIDPLLAVPGSVDFSTGNIRFEGDVQVGGGVCDRFLVQATGNVEIRQLIEAAVIHVGGDLVAPGGMAAKERGHITVGGHLTARYLNNVNGSVGGCVNVEREIIGGELEIGGNINMPRGAVIGGAMHVVGEVTVARVGSMAAIATLLELGRVPEVQAMIAQIRSARASFAEAMELLNQRMDPARGHGPKPALLDRRDRLIALDRQMQTKLELAEARLEQDRKVALTVSQMIGPGVTIMVGEQVFSFLDLVRGPLVIRRDDERMLVIAIAGGEPKALAELPQVRIGPLPVAA